MTMRCILCVLTGSLIAGLMISCLMVSSSQAAEDGVKKEGEAAKTDGISERAKKILAALDEPSNKPAKPAKNGKNPPMPMQPMPPMIPQDLSPAQQIQQFLAKADTDNSGTVSRREMGVMLEQMGPLGRELAPRMTELFRGLDRNRDDQISVDEARGGLRWLDEFRPGRRGENGGGNENRNGPNPQILALAQATIAKLDRNRDGKISMRESTGDKQVEQAFDMVDTDKDGELSAEEVYGFLQKTLPQIGPMPRRGDK